MFCDDFRENRSCLIRLNLLISLKFGNDPVPLFSRIRNNKYTANYIQIVQFIITDIITWIKDAIASVN